jgi:hypothetical protein
VSRAGIRVSRAGIRVSRAGIRVSRAGIRVSRAGIRVSRVEFGCRGRVIPLAGGTTMGKDQVDPKAAQALAWAFASTPEQLRQALDELPSAADEASPPEPAEEGVDTRTALERERRARFEAQLQAWLKAVDAQLTALEEQAAPAPQSLVALLDTVLGPPSWLSFVDCDLALRLATFLLIHRSRLDVEQRQRAAEAAGQCLNLDDPPFESWVLSVVRAGDADFCKAVGDACLELGVEQPLGGQPEAFGEALDALLKDPAITSAGKLLALRCLNASDWPVDRDAVAPALGDPDWHLRYHAVALLSDSDQLTADDLLGLLRDAASPEASMTECFELDASIDVTRFRAQLGEALRALRPPEALPLLVALLPIRRFDRDLITPGWAMGLLAQLDPERALPAIDLLLRAFESWEREVALDGLAGLPLCMARPGLQRLCGDPVGPVACRAHDLFVAKSDMAPQFDALAALPPGRLQQPPSSTLLHHLDIVCLSRLERRLQLRDKLVGVARAGRATLEDTLVLVSLLCDGELLADPPEVPNAYQPLSRWLAHLRPLLGVELELALVAMAERFPGGRAPLVAALADLHTHAPLCPEALTRARQLAHARVDAAPAPVDYVTRSTLAELGALPERWEALYPEALAAGDTFSLDALVRCGPQPALDARLRRDAGGPLDLVVRARVLDLAVQRGLQDLHAAALLLVEQAQTAEQVDAVEPLMRTLIAQAVLAPSALRAELSDASHPRFLLGFFALRDGAEQDAGIAAELITALAGPGKVPFLVLHTLLCGNVLTADDPRSLAALERMDLNFKATTLFTMLSQDADPRPLAAHLLDVLRHGNEDEVGRVDLYLAKSSYGRALLEQARREPARA